MPEMTFVQAINLALGEELAHDDRVFLMGEDIRRGYGGGIFGATQGLWEEFGDERVIDTPISEVAIGGCAAGAAWMGTRPVAEFQFADFLAIAFDQIVNSAAKFRWASEGRWGCPVVYRAPFGSRVGAGLNHSQCPDSWFANVPGLILVMPATPRDARGLLKSAIRCEDPVLFFESKYLYRRSRGEVPDEGELVPLGEAAVRRDGDDVTVVACGAIVDEALEAAEVVAERDGISAEVLDLRTLLPLDEQSILASVRRTGRLVVAHEGPVRGGVGGEIAALVAESGWDGLEAPIRRVGAPFTPVPANRDLDAQHYVPTAERIADTVRDVAVPVGR